MANVNNKSEIHYLTYYTTHGEYFHLPWKNCAFLFVQKVPCLRYFSTFCVHIYRGKRRPTSKQNISSKPSSSIFSSIHYFIIRTSLFPLVLFLIDFQLTLLIHHYLHRIFYPYFHSFQMLLPIMFFPSYCLCKNDYIHYF